MQLATELAANFAMLLRPLHGLKAFCQFIWKFMPRTLRPRPKPRPGPRRRLRLGRRFLWAPGKKVGRMRGVRLRDRQTDNDERRAVGGQGAKLRN